MENDEIFERYVQTRKEAENLLNIRSFDCFENLDDAGLLDTNDMQFAYEQWSEESDFDEVYEAARKEDLEQQERLLTVFLDLNINGYEVTRGYSSIEKRFCGKHNKDEMAIIARGVYADPQGAQFVELYPVLVRFQGELVDSNLFNDGSIVIPSKIIEIIDFSKRSDEK